MKNELVQVFEIKGNAYAGSRIIAKAIGKRHDQILRTIGSIISRLGIGSPQDSGECFVPSCYADASGKQNKEYLLTKKGFLLYMFSIEGYEKFKLAYIDKFEYMENLIRERQTTEWLQTRQQGKLIRREETDTLQDFIIYAEGQGSKNAGKYYMIFTKLVNAAVGIEAGTREVASHKDLMLVALLEDMICNTVTEEMDKNVYYKDIYKICKYKVGQFAKLTYLKVS